ncbi:MAG: alpha-L-rhamnosidase C-terminal domain-containing protein [Eubacteriales bacterium]|nr:alpha-L-rhamnosidase C-terminal domain-containing protein [Eubacteriales bacterium]MDD3880684.1 alpha-L-rhamnosidase C-terminal domain-containing protein [Eubacteriales bacterium]MDD4511682.1 alpha-L-rhamnosidase C-terminal domain-containing protein [Eubacteriales bacterium]
MLIYSDIEQIGSFECSDPRINRVQRNILWGGKSNFVDIPTDCPQRDERMGWTGDISVFSGTACFNFDLSRFFDKWLLDVRMEQNKLGGVPFVVPRQGDIYPVVPTACWGDACIIVPWAEYLARGNISLLKKQYHTMKKYLRAVKRWAGLFSIHEKRYIWKFLFQFGDWCAPEGTVKDWMSKGEWIATAYYANSCSIMERIAGILGYKKDIAYYNELRRKICDAYLHVFTDQNGKLKQEFQTGYVLPIYFGMADESITKRMAENLARLVEEKDYHLSTGFTGTPFLLFALADNGKADVAYRLLLQDTCPSWLYEINRGATTFWENWDAISPDNEQNGIAPDESDNGVSFNHYAYGAVGDFLYRRVAGIEATSGGYKSFRIKPVPGGGLRYAKARHKTPYGEIASEWKIEDGRFLLHTEVPVSTSCTVTLPSGKVTCLGSGCYDFSETISKIEV